MKQLVKMIKGLVFVGGFLTALALLLNYLQGTI